MSKSNLLVWLIVMSAILSQRASAADQLLFVGTNASQQGIYASTLDLETGEFSPAQAVGDAPYPGFLALHPNLPMLYTISREDDAKKKGMPTGGVRSFRIEAKTRQLTLINRQTTGDEGTTHLAVDPAGKMLAVANYSGGSTTLMPLSDSGAIEELTTLVKHTGSSIHPSRQKAPYAHGVAWDASGQFVCVADLGTDEVIVYRVLADEEPEEQLQRQSVWKAKPGAGPRHLSFHPNGKWLYSINELDSTLTALNFDNKTGELSELQTIGTLPSDFSGSNTTAEVVVHPSGKFVYSSNRGHDSTALFAIDANTGRLTFIKTEPTQGGHPRFIGMEPSGKYLIAANRDADNLVSFRIDQETGVLTPTGHQVSIRQPVCVVFPR